MTDKEDSVRQRILWTPEEDQALSSLRAKGARNWRLISIVMHKDFQMPERTGKQCRERWHNQLDPAIKQTTWTHEDDIALFKLHDTLGSCWIKISKYMPGKTDNNVKNRFYSALRRAVRNINRIMKQTQHKEVECFNPELISKILIASDRFNKKAHFPEAFMLKAASVKNRLIPFFSKQFQVKHPAILEIVDDIHALQKEYDILSTTLGCLNPSCKLETPNTKLESGQQDPSGNHSQPNRELISSQHPTSGRLFETAPELLEQDILKRATVMDIKRPSSFNRQPYLGVSHVMPFVDMNPGNWFTNQRRNGTMQLY